MLYKHSLSLAFKLAGDIIRYILYLWRMVIYTPDHRNENMLMNVRWMRTMRDTGGSLDGYLIAHRLCHPSSKEQTPSYAGAMPPHFQCLPASAPDAFLHPMLAC